MNTVHLEQYTEGKPVDLTPWAYVYRKGVEPNPPETAWLWPRKYLNMEVVNGSMVWHYADTPIDFKRDNVLCAFLWEEPRDIRRVEVEFPAGSPAPARDELMVACREVDSMWEDCKPWKFDPHLTHFTAADPAVTSGSEGTVYHFTSAVERFTKLYVLYSGKRADIPVPVVRAYGASCWGKPLEVEVEWGFNATESNTTRDGQVETYNGIIAGVQPLEEGNGLAVRGDNHWQEILPAAGRRGVRMQILPTVGPVNSRSLVTLQTTGGDASISLRDLDRGPILIPSLGLFAVKAGEGITAHSFQEQALRGGEKTLRQRVREHTEQTPENALHELFGDRVFPEPTPPPFEPPMKLEVPDKLLNGQWQSGAWHLSRWALKLPDGTYCVSIWPFDKGENDKVGVDGREGTAAIGAETYQILRSMDLLGQHDIAEGGLNYWIDGEHAVPFVWNAEVMGEDALSNPYNSPNHRSPGYDQKHSGGHGEILQAAAFHYRLTGNGTWLRHAAPVLAKACRAIARVRQAWIAELPEGSWGYGLIPPANTGDGGDTRLYYYDSTCWFAGLNEMADILSKSNPELKEGLTNEVIAFRQAMRRAAKRSAALCPVVKVRDGTYRRMIPWQPYLRGMDLETGLNLWYTGAIAGGLRFVQEVFGVNEPIVQEMLDVYEDVLLSHEVSQPPDGEDWFSRTGINGQCGHEVHQAVHLLADDVPLYLHSLFNGYAAEVEPDKDYMFWEGPARAGAPDKTFEEATFLERFRMMLVMEEGEDLWLARAVPRQWLEQGKKIAVANAPTFYGTLSYEITSDVANRRITATIEIPKRSAPKAVLLRLRHPKKTAIRSVEVNGQPWENFDVEKEFVRLEGLKGTVKVQVIY